VEYAQDGGRVLPCATPVHYEQRLQSVNVQPHLSKQALSCGPLNRGKADDASPVVLQQKSHPTVAEQTLSIEDNNHNESFSTSIR
jgi:hypothetical protein